MNSAVPKTLLSSPPLRQIEPAGALGDGADAVEPVVAADKVAPWPAQDGWVEGADGLQRILARRVLAAVGAARIDDAVVDAAADVLDEAAVDQGLTFPISRSRSTRMVAIMVYPHRSFPQCHGVTRLLDLDRHAV